VKRSSSSVRVLLLWPGTNGAAAGNFGVPQLVILASYVRAKTGAEVHIRDLECERAFGPIDLPRLLAGDDGRGYDVIALGCYSSFDYLKCVAIAEIARARWPESVIVAGGYHASARPDDIVYDGSPFDVCLVGEGERPLVTVIESVAGGAPLRQQVLGPDPIDDLEELPPSDWSYLARYRTVARKLNSQAQLYLSRGCPFDCAFCMERAKREVSWRALSVERAIDELRRLHAFLDLRTWTVYLADALFGMKVSWRRRFLEALARENLPVEKFWLLIRVDLVDDEDLRLFADANCGLGFGLESGDPSLLATIRKAGRLEDYLARMTHVSHRARELSVPWGANVICGHPGETPDTLARSAKYLRELFLDPRGTTGFLSVDPFRLYPGSPIDAERPAWEQRFGTRFHRPAWWHDGDQEFLAEWIDPSADLTYRRRAELQHELLTPILAAIPDHFVYQGPARDYFLRAVREQFQLTTPAHRMHFFDRYYAWNRYLGRSARARTERRTDRALADVAHTLRQTRLGSVAQRAQLASGEGRALLDAVAHVPRELFVPLDQIAASTRDVAIALDTSGQATVSAMHAYVRAFTLLDVHPGEQVLDLGAGTGYGSALLAELVGDAGRVWSVELDPLLAAQARENLATHAHVSVCAGDALDPKCWGVDPAQVRKVVVGFALAELPSAWTAALPVGAVIVAPVQHGEIQRLERFTLQAEGVQRELFDEVRYVPARSHVEPPPPAPAPRTPVRTRRRLPVLA
jgi:protein-L-isoaspartate(D-aspartate) O-methyltransferase